MDVNGYLLKSTKYEISFTKTETQTSLPACNHHIIDPFYWLQAGKSDNCLHQIVDKCFNVV